VLSGFFFSTRRQVKLSASFHLADTPGADVLVCGAKPRFLSEKKDSTSSLPCFLVASSTPRLGGSLGVKEQGTSNPAIGEADLKT
jgi:hypothetical protein